MSLTLDIEHDDTTSTLRILGPDDLGDADAPSLQSTRIERSLTRQPDQTDTAEALVYRDAWNDVEDQLDRTNDRLVIRDGSEIVFGGRLADFERDGVVVSVLIDSPKRDAIDAEPSAGNDLFNTQPDSDIVGDVLARVPTVDTGTVETVDGAIAFSESHASPGKSLTKLARDADAELRYRTTDSAFELDYVARLGGDRTDETLSPASATVLGEPRIREDIIEDVTHVRVLGAGEGTAQTEAEAVVDSFDAADNRPVYRRQVDKDIQQTDRAQSLAETLVAEYDGSPEYLEVEIEIPTHVEPSIGDTFSIALPAHDIDTTLRITMLDRIIDAAGDRFRAVLSNRRHTADSGGKERARELDSLAEGNAGQIVRDSDSQGFDKVDAGEPQEWFFDYPDDVIGEFEARLRVESQAYRRPAAATGHSHDVTINDTTSSGAAPSADDDEIYANSGTTAVEDATPTTLDSTTLDSDGWPYLFTVSLGSDSLNDLNLNNITANIRAPGVSGQNNWIISRSTETTTNAFARIESSITAFKDLSGETVELNISPAWEVSGETQTITYRWAVRQVAPHTHDVSVSDTTTTSSETALEPGIVTEGGLTPSDVSVDIDGETVVSGLDHPIQETVDISGVLSAGANQITASSNTLGELRTSVTFEAVKNVGDTQ